MFIKIELYYGDQPQGSYIDRVGLVSLSDLMDGCPPDGIESYRISRVANMTEEEFAMLPEFTGF